MERCAVWHSKQAIWSGVQCGTVSSMELCGAVSNMGLCAVCHSKQYGAVCIVAQ